MKFEYLLFNIFVASGPILALLFCSKVTKINFKSALKSIGFSAFLFIVWDITTA